MSIDGLYNRNAGGRNPNFRYTLVNRDRDVVPKTVGTRRQFQSFVKKCTSPKNKTQCSCVPDLMIGTGAPRMATFHRTISRAKNQCYLGKQRTVRIVMPIRRFN